MIDQLFHQESLVTTSQDRAYEDLRSRLVLGEFQPGDRLVTRSLAEEFGISLSPVREALQRLASEGLVEHVPGAGARVKQLSVDELDELYVLRDAVESYAAGLAADQMSAADHQELAVLVDEMESLAEKINQRGRATAREQRRWLQLEEQFHQSVVRGSRNQLLSKVIRDYRTLASVFSAHRQVPQVLSGAVAERTVQGKRQLIEALSQRQPEQARQAMSQQIQAGRRDVIRRLRQLSQPSTH